MFCPSKDDHSSQLPAAPCFSAVALHSIRRSIGGRMATAPCCFQCARNIQGEQETADCTLCRHSFCAAHWVSSHVIISIAFATTTKVPVCSHCYETSSQVWQPDSQRDTCLKCHAHFRFFRRRHHCRMCGMLFCDACSHQKKVVQLTYPSPKDSKVRVCDDCQNRPTTADLVNDARDMRDSSNTLSGYSQITLADQSNFNFAGSGSKRGSRAY